ncbi:MAG: D-sedoheptulose 7-phosphate isomerase [Bacteroidetes bacterium]|nr:D-sedoheptulose 7-phosphate isomerase [Bacteroidota bacterium]
MNDKIKNIISASIAVKQAFLEDEKLVSTLNTIAEAMVTCLKAGHKVLWCGNGGSAADAQHLAAELSGRFYIDRAPLYSEALHVNSSFVTAVANDYSYDVIYSRMLQGCGREGDIIVGISTSGNSKNVIQALEVAREKKMITIGFTGSHGGNMKDLCDFLINIPSNDTPRIQESHILAGHIVCQLVEDAMFASS